MDRTDISLIALRRILRATELYGRRLAKEAGIAEHGHATPTAIANRMGVTQATMTALINKLVERQLVERRRSETDRRQTNVCITPRGTEAVDDAPDPLQQRYVKNFEALEDWEQAMIVASLERVAAMLDADGLDASPVLDLGEFGKAQ